MSWPCLLLLLVVNMSLARCCTHHLYLSPPPTRHICNRMAVLCGLKFFLKLLMGVVSSKQSKVLSFRFFTVNVMSFHVYSCCMFFSFYSISIYFSLFSSIMSVLLFLSWCFFSFILLPCLIFFFHKGNLGNEKWLFSQMNLWFPPV